METGKGRHVRLDLAASAGERVVKALVSLVLVLAVVYVLFQYVFPWAEPLLPFNDVTVDNQ